MAQRPIALPWYAQDERGEPVVLREATGADAQGYLEHMRRIVSETQYMLQCPADSLPSVGEQRRIFDHLERSKNSAVLLAIRPDRERALRVCGSATMLGGRSRRTRHVVSLGMGVDRTDWGLGIGSGLLDAALTWARRNPMLARMSLQVFSSNTQARRLYLSRGFLEEGTLVAEAFVAGSFEPLVGMGVDVA